MCRFISSGLALGLLFALAPGSTFAQDAATEATAELEPKAPQASCGPENGFETGNAVFLACVCLTGNSVECSGTGSSCTAASTAFRGDCHSQAVANCAPDLACKVTYFPGACTGGGGSFTVSGSASYGCRFCP